MWNQSGICFGRGSGWEDFRNRKNASSSWLRFLPAGNAEQQQVNDNCVRSPKISRLEAVLIVADSPITAKKITEAAKLVDVNQARHLIEELNELYDADKSPFRVEQIASGYQLLTRPEYSQWLDRIHHRNVELKLTAPALETLTIIAYRQKITRADVEAIRGVQSSEVIKQLMERQLIRIGGEEDSLGRPYLYETTKFFLQYLGIRRIEQLPNYEQFRAETAKMQQEILANEQVSEDDAEEDEEINNEELEYDEEEDSEAA